ncbi:MAG TPA: YebC/PmpR family DNA-binding transcriptional regulator [Anaerovoracaceae bacterium]|nr:YebC/PmpR family DNA-binding transcriptional regulator [Anaerovoracaceae bacterium]
MGRHGTIAGRKAAQDAKKGKIFTKYARAISVAAKAGGDPEYNIALKHAIDKAKAINMPNDNINRAIQRGTGEAGGAAYESGAYEGYGPGGVAVIVDVLTDNRNRTSSDIKHAFDKNGGNLGVPGCVSYMFDRKGILLIEKKDFIDEDSLMEAALEAGAEDILIHEDSYEIQTLPEDFDDASKALKNAGYDFAESDIELVPSIEASPDKEELAGLIKMIDMLEENDDVQNVFHNSSVPF